MLTKFTIIAFAVLAFGFASAPHSNADSDMIIDNSAQAPPPPSYRYAPPPPVYYAPPPVQIVVAPAYGYYARPVRVFGYHRVYAHRGFRHHGRSDSQAD